MPLEEFEANSCSKSENNVFLVVEEKNLEDSGESPLSEICIGSSPMVVHCLSFDLFCVADVRLLDEVMK